MSCADSAVKCALPLGLGSETVIKTFKLGLGYTASLYRISFRYGPFSKFAICFFGRKLLEIAKMQEIVLPRSSQ